MLDITNVPLQTELENHELSVSSSRPERTSLDERSKAKPFRICATSTKSTRRCFYQWQRQFFENGTATLSEMRAENPFQGDFRRQSLGNP